MATPVAIWQKASWGVRMLIACQFRFRTRTVALFSLSSHKSFAYGHCRLCIKVFVFIEKEVGSPSSRFALRRGKPNAKFEE